MVSKTPVYTVSWPSFKMILTFAVSCQPCALYNHIINSGVFWQTFQAFKAENRIKTLVQQSRESQDLEKQLVLSGIFAVFSGPWSSPAQKRFFYAVIFKCHSTRHNPPQAKTQMTEMIHSTTNTFNWNHPILKFFMCWEGVFVPDPIFLSLQMAGRSNSIDGSLLDSFSRGRVLIAPGLLEEIPARLESVGLKPAALVPELVWCKNSFEWNWLERGDLCSWRRIIFGMKRSLVRSLS